MELGKFEVSRALSLDSKRLWLTGAFHLKVEKNMPKSKQVKQDNVAELKEVLSRAKSLVFASFEKLPVKEIEKLRREAKKGGVVYSVAKKTLLGRAVKESGIQIDPKTLPGGFATLIGIEDDIAPAKIAALFAKDHEAMQIVGGVLEGRAIDAKTVIALSKLPGRDELLAKLVGSLMSPVSGFANVLAGNLRGLVTVLGAIKDQKNA